MSRKRGHKTEVDLVKENIELKKENKILSQQVASMRRRLAKLEKVAEAEKPASKELDRCKKCESPNLSKVAHPVKGMVLACKDCRHRENI